MSKDEGGWNSSLSEKPVRSSPRRLVTGSTCRMYSKRNKGSGQETEPGQTGLRRRGESLVNGHRVSSTRKLVKWPVSVN
jgi:hypothetical protein